MCIGVDLFGFILFGVPVFLGDVCLLLLGFFSTMSGKLLVTVSSDSFSTLCSLSSPGTLIFADIDMLCVVPGVP